METITELLADGWTTDEAATHLAGDCEPERCLAPSHRRTQQAGADLVAVQTATLDILDLLERVTAPLEVCSLCGCLCHAWEVCPGCHARRAYVIRWATRDTGAAS